MTFSKGFSPGLRLGYGHLPEELVTPVLNQKGNHDFGSSNLAQHLAHQALITGVYDKHVERLRERYRAKRDLMLRVIHEEFPESVRVIEPQGGLYVWATLPEGVSSGPESHFFREALRRHVLYVPGCYCYAQERDRAKPDNQMRLCYGYIDEEPMVEGLKRLAATATACLKGSG
jgi:2-aminoadipate transaminase